ncbi:MAG: multidrug transporter ATP-binding protein, partial [Ilumatobacteraceae bacterium]|nr:multidrug transporter ATP-binding protein [Ilumatobacteraceae bacterium]
MLTRLLISRLRPYRRQLALVVLLQGVQAIAALFLPRLNAHVIDRGVATGDTGYIWRIGTIMLLITLVQIAFAVSAVYVGSRVAMGFGRDVRNDMFHQVTGFSAREVSVFGAPSLITRITNDVQQVQMLVQMTCTLLIAAPITIVGGLIMALREDVGLSWIVVVAIPLLVLAIGSVIKRMVPQFRVMQERIDRLNQILREQITGMRVVRAFVREPDEARRFQGANDQVTETALKAGRLMAFMFPTAILTINMSSVAVLWLGAN